MPVSKLNSDEIKVAINQLDHWLLEPQQPSIYKEWNFNNFRTTINVLDQICELAELQDHHPEILTNYTHLKIRLWTHDAKGLTHKDFTLASAIDQLITSKFYEGIQH
jgi:4a-hydroxytetrahydrobiopterin dehydratase